MPSTKQIELKILDKRIGENSQFPLPSYKTEGAAGIDLYAMPEESLVLNPDRKSVV